MSPVGWALLIGVVVAVALGAIISRPWLAAALQAHRDYRRARGTIHRAEIERSLLVLDQRIAVQHSEVERLVGKLRADAGDEQAELNRALAEHLVATRLDDVPGLGATRVESIRRTLFRGRLDDLRRADDVPGIGPQTAPAIAAWVARMEREWSGLLGAEFPGKADITARYVERRRPIEDELARAKECLGELEAIAGAARGELARLREITPRDFRRSLRSIAGSDEADLRWYVLGVYPPWAAPPAWYAAMQRIAAAAAKG